MQYLLGLDNGNTVTKAAIFDEQGNEIAVASQEVRSQYPLSQHVERDMHELWQQSCKAIKQAIKLANIDSQDIKAVGCSGHGNGLYLLDRNHQPLKAIQSLDSRATSMVEDWGKRGLQQKIYQHNLQGIWPAQSGMLLAWLKQNQRPVFDNIGSVLMCKDYINYCLTHQIATDYSDMSGAGLLDMDSKNYSQPLFEHYGIESLSHCFPKLYESQQVIGQITNDAAMSCGLLSGTPVVAGMFDVVANAIGSGVNQTQQASIIAGTWSVNQVIVDQPINDERLFMNCVFDQKRYLSIESSATSATNLQWFVNTFCKEEKEILARNQQNIFEHCNQLVESVTLEKNLPLYHPFLYGATQLNSARAGFYAIAGWHSKADMLHAVYEGVVYAHLTHVENLRSVGANFESAVLSGGGSNSKVWSQMFADILQVPIEVSQGEQLGAKGAAITAAVAIGIYPDRQTAIDAMCKVIRVHSPDVKNKALYQYRYEAFTKLCELMADPWKALQ